jgi:translation initiation factor 1A
MSSSRSLILKTYDHEYGVVTKKLGNGRFSVRLNITNKEVNARVCGKFRTKKGKKNNWVEVDTVVLVGLRDFQDDIVDIVHVYTPEEVRQLKKEGEYLVDNGGREGDTTTENDDIGFDFNSI